MGRRVCARPLVARAAGRAQWPGWRAGGRGSPTLRRAAAQTPNALSWIKEMSEYNVPKGKLNRGLAVLDGALAA